MHPRLSIGAQVRRTKCGSAQCRTASGSDRISSATTSFTPRSAMTSFTGEIAIKCSLAAEGARRATAVAKEHWSVPSSRAIVILCQRDIVDAYSEFLPRYINSRNDVLVNHLRRQLELFAKDIQQRITSDEAHHVIAASFWLWQGMARRQGRVRKADLPAALLQCCLRRLPLQLAIAITTIMLLLEEQRFRAEIRYAANGAQEALPEMVVKLLHYAVAPRLSHGDEPGLNAMRQTQANQHPHSPWVLAAAVEHQLIIYLLMFWYPQTTPVRPDSVDRLLSGLTQDRSYRATAGRHIHTVETVKAHRPTQVTGANIIGLMHAVGAVGAQLRILLALWFVATRASLRQTFSLEHPINRARAGQWCQPQIFQLPGNSLSTTEQSLVVQLQPHELDCFHNFIRQLSRIAMGISFAILRPLYRCFARAITVNPFVNPGTRVTQRLGDSSQSFACQVSLDGQCSVTLLFVLHAFLLRERLMINQITPQIAGLPVFKELSTMSWHFWLSTMSWHLSSGRYRSRFCNGCTSNLNSKFRISKVRPFGVTSTVCYHFQSIKFQQVTTFIQKCRR